MLHLVVRVSARAGAGASRKVRFRPGHHLQKGEQWRAVLGDELVVEPMCAPARPVCRATSGCGFPCAVANETRGTHAGSRREHQATLEAELVERIAKLDSTAKLSDLLGLIISSAACCVFWPPQPCMCLSFGVVAQRLRHGFMEHQHQAAAGRSQHVEWV